MYNIEIEIDVAKFEKDINDLVKDVKNGIEEGIKLATTNTRMIAMILVEYEAFNTGKLRNSVETELNIKPNEIVGEIFVDINQVPYIMYVYYGTGIYRGRKGWWTNKKNVINAEKYRTPTRNASNGETYIYFKGQRPKPFLEEALNSTIEENMDIILNAIDRAIGR